MTTNKLSLDDFKHWMETHQEEHHMERPRDSFIGICVEPKSTLSPKRLMTKMQTDEENLSEIAADFQQYGGVVVDVDGMNFMIEVDSGKFSIHRCYVTKS